MSWSRRFDRPIALPNGGELTTLRDAGDYVTALPKATQREEHWQTATAELLLAAERGGILMMAEMAMRQALAHGQPKPTAPSPRKRVKAYRVIR
jgi:hypothetical protein